MGIFSFVRGVLGGNKAQVQDRPKFSPQDEKKLRQKAEIFLNDDHLQSSSYPKDLFPELHEEKYRMDENPNAAGDFGHDPQNPIPCNGPLGEVTYISRLLTEDSKEKVYCFRRCSMAGNSVSGNVDVYIVVSQSGQHVDVLYMDMYHPAKSNKVPEGYCFAEKVEAIRGTSACCKIDKFLKDPYGYCEAFSFTMLPISMADADAKHIDAVRAKESYKKMIK